MIPTPRAYLEVLKIRDFFILILTLFIGQVASAFLLLSLISSVFTKTGSNFGVSGVILSLSVPGFLIMAFSGLVADLVDRKKIIIFANCLIALVVLLIILSLNKVFASISLAFLYFAGNSFFIPAVSAAQAQLVRRQQLMRANSLFIVTLSGGQIIGLFFAAIFNFLVGHFAILVFTEFLLIICIFLPMLLPPLVPRRQNNSSIIKTISDIWRAFTYIFKAKVVWFFFLTFAAVQGIVAFGATLGPGFFDEVLEVSIDRSPLLIMPSIAIGILLGAFFNPGKARSSFIVALGLGAIGLAASILGIIISYGLISGVLLILPVSVFLVFSGFGVIIAMITSRTALQMKVSYHYFGTVFGANIVLSAFLASLMSPAAAGIELLVGYVNVLIFGGLLFLIASSLIGFVGKKAGF